MNDSYCNNCGKAGHLYHQCKMPITSIGIIVVRIHNNQLEYLMIRRKDTLGYIDFMRGKYSVCNKDYILNMFKQMTTTEKQNLKTLEFNQLWKGIWGDELLSNQYKSEESISREKFNNLRHGVILKNDSYTLNNIIDDSNSYDIWEEAEWGFPKGRRNYQEKDLECAVREFTEETGYNSKDIKHIQNIIPFEEIFTGSNYKSYKHKYFLAYMRFEDTLCLDNFEKTEVSKMEWKKYEDCIECIRPYNLEKKRLITNVHQMLKTTRLFSI
jgi:8-oxo-dGTP pyrophosphatase MutT (NUDIX family)